MSVSLQAQGPNLTRHDITRYRVISAPLEKIEELAVGEYRPMPRDEFHRRVEALQQQLPAELHRNAAITTAKYSGRLVGRRLLTGLATWDVTHLHDSPAWLSFGRLNLALSESRWIAESGESHAADLGTDAAGVCLLEVREAGTLQARWTMAPTSTSSDELVFDLQLPPCPVQRLDLQVPVEFELEVSHGVVRQLARNQDSAPAHSSPGAVPAVDEWQINLGGHRSCQIRLHRRNARRPQARLTQVSRYVISEHGLDVTADLMLDCDDVELSRLVLRLDAPLKITKVVHESQALSWTESGASNQASVVTVNFALPLRGLNRTVRISAVAPPELVADRTLPRIRIPNVDWLQESARLQINPPFVLHDLKISSGVRAPLTDDNGPIGSWLAFQYIDSDHQIRLQLAKEAEETTFKTATNLIAGPNELQANVEVDLRGRLSDQFQVEVEIREGWNVESVESAEAASNVVDEWHVLSSPTSTRRLQIRFKRPLSSDIWTRLSIRARHSFELSAEPISIEQLQPIIFATVQQAPRQFLSLPAQDGVQIRYPHDGRITWLSWDDLDARETQLIDTPAPDRLILMDRQSLNEFVVLDETVESASSMTANLRIVTQLSSHTVKEQVRVELTRIQGPPREFRVHLSQRRSSEFRWHLDQSPQRELSARREPARVGEVWRIAWPDSSETSLVVIGERSWPTEADNPIALARVTDAESQEGIIVVEASADTDLALSVSPLFTPLPSGQNEFRRFDNPRYVYRYGPMADIFSRNNTMSVSVTPYRPPNARLVVWRAAVETNLDQSGIVRSDVSLWIENLGVDHLRVRLPNQDVLRQVDVDGQEVTPVSDAAGWLQLPMPAGRRFPLVQLHYDRPSGSLGWLRSLQPEYPEIAAPVLNRRWHIWTPPDFEITINGSARTASSRLNFFQPRLRSPSGSLTERPFNLFSASDWKDGIRRIWTPNDQLTPNILATLQALGRDDPLTVGYWLQTIPSVEIKVDQVRLAEIGVQPQTGLPAAHQPDEVLRGIQRLHKLHLGLLSVEDEVIVTAESMLAELPMAVICRDSTSIAKLTGRDAMRWRQRDGDPPYRPLVSAAQWQAQSVTWPSIGNDRAPFVSAGWHVHAAPISSAARVTVFRYSTLRVLSCVSLLTGLSLTWWLGRSGLRRSLLTPALCLIVVLVSASPFHIVALNALWGSLIGMLIPRFRKRFASRTEDQSTVSRRRTAQLTATAILVAAFLTAPRDASGQPAESAINGSATLEVFDPIDANGNSEGLLLHVPHTLYRQLSEAQSPTFGQEPSWILRHATYTGVLEPKTDPSRMQLSTITADFELNVYHLGGAIRFPLAGQAVTALKREAFLDGRRFELQWEAARSTIALPIRQTGRHHLQLSFQTVTEIEAGVAHVRLPIPVTPQAKLFLTSPQDLQLLQVPSAGGGVQRLESQGQLSADLGPTDHLHIQWPTPTTTNLAPAIEHLGWLRLQRDEARYDIQIVPDMTRLKESAIVLEVDERLQLDTASNEDRLSLVPVAERGVRGLRFDLTDIDQGSSVIRLSFVVTSATGIGRIRLPRCRVLNHDVPLLLGVSADPRLGLRVTPDNATLLATDDFMLRWGGSLSPEFAYELPSSGSRWTCQGQWIESVPRVDVREAQIVDRGGTRVVLVATINANAQKLYQQELSVPEAFVIENIQALSTSHSSLIRWFRHPNNRLTILLDDPSSDRLQIAIVGYCPDSELDSRVLPRITFPGTIMERRQVDLFRTSDVLVRGLAIDQLPPPPDLAPFIRNQVGLARWQQRNEDPTQDDWTISLKANDRQLSARMYNVVSREQGEWHHRVRAEYQMDKGVLDSLTFEIPEAWAAAMMEEPGLRHYYSQAARLGTVRVTLWQHPRPFDRGSALEFSGKIQTQPGQPLTVPNIRLLNEGHIERQLYLPIRLDGQPILWSTTGMQPLDNAEPPATLKQAGAEYEAFAISDAPFQAVRLPVRTAHGVPALTLTDVHIAWQSPSDYQGMALMDLDPNGLDECLLHVPSQLTVVAIYVDQTPVTPRASDQSTLRTGKRYRFQLASNELPQRIRVMFSGKSSDDPAASSQSVMSPTLYHQGAHQPDTDVEIPADVTLWTVYQTGTGTMDLKGELATVSQLDKLRLVHFSDVMDQAASLATDFSPDDLARWYSVWGRRFLTATGRMQIHSRAAAGKDDAMSEAVLHARERHVEVATQLKVDAVYQQLQLDEGLGDSTGVWLDALAPTKPPSHQAFEGNKSQLTVVYHPPSPTSQYFRWIAALLIGLAVLATQRWPLTPIPFN